MQPAQLVHPALVPTRAWQEPERRLNQVSTQRNRQPRVFVRVQVAVVSVVAAEQFVATVAPDHHLHVFPGQAGRLVGAERKRIGRLVEVMDEVGQQGDQRGLKRALMVDGRESTSHLAGLGCLVVLRVRHRYGERRQVPDPQSPREHRHQQARIQSATQKRPDRHIADEVQA